LDLARADLAAGAFVQAQARAEGVLRALVPASVRATALVLAGDAAYALGAYRTAANRYREAVRADQLPAEAAHTGFALGWAALRLGRRDQAQYTWGQVAQQFPADPGAPLALIWAAELAAQANDLAGAQKRLDQVLEGYPTAPEAEIARLSRSIVALREGRTQEAVRDLRTLALSSRPSLPQERRMLLDRSARYAPWSRSGTGNRRRQSTSGSWSLTATRPRFWPRRGMRSGLRGAIPPGAGVSTAA